MSLLPSASVSQNFLADNTIPSKTGSTCTRCVFSLSIIHLGCYEGLTNGRDQHSISLQVQLPTDTSKPEWKLDGTIVTIPDLPLNLLVSTLRDRIIAATSSALSAGRVILSYNGKMLTNRNTIASYNLEDEDLLVLSVRDPKKK
jgi:hypothetical protein